MEESYSDCMFKIISLRKLSEFYSFVYKREREGGGCMIDDCIRFIGKVILIVC